MILAKPSSSALREHGSLFGRMSPLEDRYHDSFYQFPYRDVTQRKAVHVVAASVPAHSTPGKTATQQKSAQHGEGTKPREAVVLSPGPSSHMATTTLPKPSQMSTRPRPPSLVLQDTFGSTGLKSAELRQQICNASPASSPTILQIPSDDRTPLPPTPTTPFSMGNKPSSVSGDLASDDKSLRSVVRHGSCQAIPRKGSYNIFKRVDSKSPLARDVTTSVMSVLHREIRKEDASLDTDDDDHGLVHAYTDTHPTQDLDVNGRQSISRNTRPVPHSGSTMTMTEKRAGMPLSASSTIRGSRSPEQCSAQLSQADGANDTEYLPSISPADDEASHALSPTIPAPSPLPEDTPHKYGLRDDANTPEVPEVRSQENDIFKMKRRSSGLEIFNEARTLQSAQSFLNGLSSSRRRAESSASIRATDNPYQSGTTAYDAASRPDSARPLSSQRPEYLPRLRGHNFKSSGFAHSRPLKMNQIKCYIGHNRILPSKNKHAPVECAVCHIDDSADHFSCSWCALRMCRLCREDFAQRGLPALRERIRKAELGGCIDSGHSSSSEESLRALRKTKSSTVVW